MSRLIGLSYLASILAAGESFYHLVGLDLRCNKLRDKLKHTE